MILYGEFVLFVIRIDTNWWEAFECDARKALLLLSKVHVRRSAAPPRRTEKQQQQNITEC